MAEHHKEHPDYPEMGIFALQDQTDAPLDKLLLLGALIMRRRLEGLESVARMEARKDEQESIYASPPTRVHNNLPKNGCWIQAQLYHKADHAIIQYDSTWGGGRGGWFDIKGHAVAEKDIWEFRILSAKGEQMVKDALAGAKSGL